MTSGREGKIVTKKMDVSFDKMRSCMTGDIITRRLKAIPWDAFNSVRSIGMKLDQR